MPGLRDVGHEVAALGCGSNFAAVLVEFLLNLLAAVSNSCLTCAEGCGDRGGS